MSSETAGNAGQAPGAAREFRALVRANTVAALETVLEVMRTGKPAEQLKAAEIILDRAYGRSAQPVDAEVKTAVRVEFVLPPGLDELLG